MTIFVSAKTKDDEREIISCRKYRFWDVAFFRYLEFYASKHQKKLEVHAIENYKPKEAHLIEFPINLNYAIHIFIVGARVLLKNDF